MQIVNNLIYAVWINIRRFILHHNIIWSVLLGKIRIYAYQVIFGVQYNVHVNKHHISYVKRATLFSVNLS